MLAWLNGASGLLCGCVAIYSRQCAVVCCDVLKCAGDCVVWCAVVCCDVVLKCAGDCVVWCAVVCCDVLKCARDCVVCCDVVLKCAGDCVL